MGTGAAQRTVTCNCVMNCGTLPLYNDSSHIRSDMDVDATGQRPYSWCLTMWMNRAAQLVLEDNSAKTSSGGYHGMW